jgi:hypothetical protein
MREFIQQPQVPLSSPGLEPRRGFFHSFSGGVSTLLILLAILYVGMLLLSRTAGFSEIVRGQLEKHIGLEFKVGHSALTPSFALVLEDVKGVVPKNVFKAGVAAKRVVIRWSWINYLVGGDPLAELLAEDVDLLFAPDSTDRWQPAQFGQISDWLAQKMQLDLSRYSSRGSRSSAAQDPSEDELDLFSERRVEMKNALVHWQVVAGSEIARADGVSLASTRVQLPNREITHFLVSIRKADTAQGFHAESKRMELLAMGDDRDLWIEGGPTNIPVILSHPLLRPLEPRKPLSQTNGIRTVIRSGTDAVEKIVPPQGPPTGSPDPKPEE